MRGLNCLRRIGTLVFVGALAGCAFAASPAADWLTWDIGAFRMRTPAGMGLKSGGIDSQAGTLASNELRIDYDFGRYSDPLTRRDGMLDYLARAGTVDGLAAQFVHFRTTDTAAPARYCAAVHVPAVRTSSTEASKLTVVACGANTAALRDVPSVFDSIRFQGIIARP